MKLRKCEGDLITRGTDRSEFSTSFLKDNPFVVYRQKKTFGKYIHCLDEKSKVMGIHQFSVIVLLFLCAFLSTYGQPPEVRQRYERFLNQHVYGQMSKQRCDSEIRKRHITARPDTNDCKEVNSFIQANSQDVRAVCKDGGTPYPGGRNLVVSTKKFGVVTCNLRSGARQPNCVYRGRDPSTRKIVVACDGEWPTHYEEGIIVV